MPRSAFVYPKQRLYPVTSPGQARAALRFAGKKSTRGSYAKVEKVVNRRFPQIGTKHHTPRGKR
jgi:hypothetical protein